MVKSGSDVMYPVVGANDGIGVDGIAVVKNIAVDGWGDVKNEGAVVIMVVNIPVVNSAGVDSRKIGSIVVGG